ncbi:MAG: hypothetical protein ACI8TX_003852 [Hyphomicrobiaceae bacterium]|jgi:hypothetical protein
MARVDWMSAGERPRWVPPGTWIPSWLALRHGTRPIIVVAPHGGRRQRPVRRGDGVNDLATADLACELARRLNAHAIVNHGLDRNRIDLNRTSEVAAHAPVLAQLLHSAVRDASMDGSRPLVVFIHGWNMVVPCCDLGMGMREVDGRLFGARPTLSRVAYEGVVARLRSALEARGIAAAVGRRYPASGADNLCQVFSGRFINHDDPYIEALSALSRAGEVNALQLELGIPLRWQGGAREDFLDAVVAAFGQPADAKISVAGVDENVGPSAEANSDATNGSTLSARKNNARTDWELPPIKKGWRNTKGLEPGYSLQACLGAGDTGLFCGVEPAGVQSMSARFSLVVDGGPMFLLVGEGPWDGTPGTYSLEGLRWHTQQDGRTRIVLDGAMIRYADHNAYLDLERGLGGARLVRGRGELLYIPEEHGRGHLQGQLEIDGQDIDIARVAFAERGGRTGSGARLRLRAIGPFHAWSWDGLPAVDVSGEETSHPMMVVPRDGAAASQPSTQYAGSGNGQGPAGGLSTVVTAMVHDRDGAAPDRLEVFADDGSLIGTADVRARVPVWRDAAVGVWARWTFGLVSWHGLGDAPVPGTFERLELFRQP